MVDRERRERRVTGVVGERDRVGGRLHRGSRAGRALGDHDRRGLDREHRLGRLVGACPSAHVDHRLGIPQGRPDRGLDARIGPAGGRVGAADAVVQCGHGHTFADARGTGAGHPGASVRSQLGSFPHRSGRRPDWSLSSHPARGGVEGGPAAQRHGVRPLRAERQSGGRGQAQVLLHLLVRPEAAGRTRRGGHPAPARGARPDRRPPQPAPHDRVGTRQPRLALPRLAESRGRAAALARRRADGRRAACRRCRSTTGTS